MKNQDNDTYSLAHTRWKCQYHLVFTPKYHRKIIYGALRAEIGKILRELCKRKEVEIIEAHAMPDHIHMLVSIPPNEKVSSFVAYLKGKSSLMIYQKLGSMKYKLENRHFWCRGYYVSTSKRPIVIPKTNLYFLEIFRTVLVALIQILKYFSQTKRMFF